MSKMFMFKKTNNEVQSFSKEKFVSMFKDKKKGESKWDILKSDLKYKYKEAKFNYIKEGDCYYVYGSGLDKDLVKEIVDNVVNKNNGYYLMHKNIICLSFNIDKKINISNVKILNKNHLPYIFYNRKASIQNRLKDWIKERSIPKNRAYYDRIIKNLKNLNPIEIVIMSKGLRVTDCYWIKKQTSNDTWEKVNFFDNTTSDILDKIYIDSDEFNSTYRVDSETLLNPNTTSEGSLPKVWKKENNVWKLYKDNIKYNEKDNEVLWSKILDYVGIPHIKYSIGYLKDKEGNTKRLCVSDNYCSKDKEFISAYNLQYCYTKKNEENDAQGFYRYCEEQGIKNVKKFMSDQFIMDYILANADRHWNNFGIIRNPDTLKYIEMMPIYDNGNSMWFKSDVNDVFKDPNLNFLDKKVKGENTKESLRYVEDWSLLENKKIYDIPKLIEKIRMETNDDYSQKRLKKEIIQVENHIKYLKKIKDKGYNEVVKEEKIKKYNQ